MSDLSAEERILLAPYVTSLEKPVFALTNLPEVIKGALFSRYSRSQKGLRRLLLDEFLLAKESGFTGTAAIGLLNLTRAQEFYDRILDGYGDDSIGELGGAHLALEQVSNIASKAIEDCRIGGSPLEKSTRYVRFDQKTANGWQYLRESAIMASRHADRYLAAMDTLFQTYSDMMDPLISLLKERIPQGETPKAAYDASVRARACDALRGLLPASTLTNVGVFGNGRFFESLIVKLRMSPLGELCSLGESAQEELDKVIPSFVRRSKPEHRHFAGFAQHRETVRKALNKAAETERTYRNDSELREVTLVHHDPDAEERVLAAILYSQGHQPFAACLAHAHAMDAQQRDRLYDAYLSGRENRRHKPGRALEHARYTFDILADFGSYRDLQRHRMLTQERQLLSTRHGYIVPALVEDAGFAASYREALDNAAECFQQIEKDMPQEAQYCVPFAFRLRWHMAINLRALLWLCELRTVPQGHEDYRRIAQGMCRAVQAVHPRLARCFQFVDMNAYQLGRLQSEIRAADRN